MDREEGQGKLSIVATPIGNMGDLTFRALWNLKECNAIYAEDTRVIGKLLAHYGLRTSVFRLDAATEDKKAKEVIEKLQAGEHVVYVTDAGTPGLSDPGSRLVERVRRFAPEVLIDAIPGASALTALISIAGLDLTEFAFLGFPPHKKGRQTFAKRVAKSEVPVIVYESPHRIIKFLEEMKIAAPNCRVTIGRELTKMHEEVLTGSPEEIATQLKKKGGVRGEFVVIVEPKGGR